MAQRRPVSWGPGDDTDPELTPPAHSGFSFSRSASHHAAALIAALPSRQISMDSEGTIQRSGSERLSLKLRRRQTMKRLGTGDYLDGDIEMQPLNSSERPTTLSADEADMWEKTQSLRGMTASLTTKRKFRSRLMNEPVKRLKGFQKWKHTRRVEWRRFKDRVADSFSSLIIWNGSFKQIEGAFGMGIGSYYRFLKLLFQLNIVIALIMILPITVPQAIFSPATFNESLLLVNFSTAALDVPLISAQVAVSIPSPNDTSGVAQALTSSTSVNFVADAMSCSANYTATVDERVAAATPLESVLSFLQGDGWMTNTILFAGYYFNKTVYSQGDPVFSYNMPLAYILATGAYFLFSLIVMVTYIGEGFRQNFLEGEGKMFAYCNNTFGGWDYCISTEKAAKMKQKILYADLTRDLENERMKMRRSNRTTKEKFSLYIKRIFINIVVITVLCGAGYLIFLSNKYSLEWGQLTTLNDFVKLIVEYLPALVISILNFIIPLMFIHIVRPEDYTPEFEIRITLLRTVFLRLASLTVLILSVYTQITNCETYVCGNCQTTSYCWETFIGQQFYKLVMLDFFIPVGIAIFVEFPRKLLWKKFNDKKIFKLIGEQEFIIAKQVLDIVYSQTLCWIGAFFCPIIPGMTVVKFFILFYIKKYVLLFCCVPSARTYRASNSNAFFTSMLLLSFILTCLPVGWSIAKISPSQSCGAFRIYSKADFVMFDSITNVIGTWPQEAKDVFYFLGSPAFYAPLAVLLLILIYYYYCVASGHERMIEILKDELAMEGKDKKFLLDRVYEAQMKKESLSRQAVAS
ncbi:transmembrane channel-like protein 7 isoform X2 [Lineus longissimus]|uniref:transmembrane channel-like protein 7 isoform X2 n=1 Tax=Lineus longissimus TaxID=88925 RepID=UPI002B4EE970